MLPKTIAKYHRVAALIKNGMTTEDAIKQEGMGSATYYDAKKQIENSNQKQTRKYTKRKPVIEIPLKTQESDKVTLVICNPGQIKDVLGSLQ